MARSRMVILDAGGENNVRMARALREMGVYSEIWAHDTPGATLSGMPGLCGIVVSVGANRAFEGQTLPIADDVFAAGVNVLSAGALDARATTSVPVWHADASAEAAALSAFADACGADRSWNMKSFIEEQVRALRAQIGGERVLLALSGGVDSSVVCALLHRAVGDRLTCVHVNHGLLRKGEAEQVVRVFREEMGANLVYVDAQERFLSKLENVADPEAKRKIIGEEFIRVFEEEARKLGTGFFLAQGTIYPDILESGTKTARLVKSHHNTGGLPPELGFTLVEPIKYLFKDEVRALGEALGLPRALVYRQPFPGPGLGVRCVGAITRERLEIVRESDAILREEFAAAGLDARVWQYFTVVPDVRSTGVRGGARCFEYPVVLRAVNTRDAMTAEIEEIPYEVLHRVTRRMQSEVPGCNRVLYDLSPKPVATIEWE